MSENSQISIIIPLFNGEHYLKECLDSVVNQTYKNLDIIIVNDGGTDGSEAIAKSFQAKDSRIRYFYKANGGVSSARNKGIDEAKGDFIMFVDQDDVVLNDCCESLMNAIMQYKTDIAIGQVTTPIIPWQYGKKDAEVWTGDRSVQECLKDNPDLYTIWARLYRKSLIGETRLTERVHEDSFYNFVLACKKPSVVIIKKEVYYYRHNLESASFSAFSDKYIECMSVAEKTYQITAEKFPSFKDLAENYKIKSALVLLRILATRTNGEYKSLEKQLIQQVRENKKYYISVDKKGDLWLFIVVNHLYPLFKMVAKFKKRK